MLYIQKQEPEWFLEFKRKNPHAAYDSEKFAQMKGRLREELIHEQKGLCAYCCGRIRMGSSHNEHIEPRNPGTYASEKSLDYYNLVASCEREDTCGKRKGNAYERERFVSPIDPECEEKFTYYPDGVIDGDEYTINLLNLNEYELRNARKATYRGLQRLDREMIEMIYMKDDIEEAEPYLNVIK